MFWTAPCNGIPLHNRIHGSEFRIFLCAMRVGQLVSGAYGLRGGRTRDVLGVASGRAGDGATGREKGKADGKEGGHWPTGQRKAPQGVNQAGRDGLGWRASGRGPRLP